MDKQRTDLLDEIINYMEITDDCLSKYSNKLQAINEKANNVLMYVETQNAQIHDIDRDNDGIYSFSGQAYQTMAQIIELGAIGQSSPTMGNFSAINGFCNAYEARLNAALSSFRKLKTFGENLAELTEMLTDADADDNESSVNSSSNYYEDEINENPDY